MPFAGGAAGVDIEQLGSTVAHLLGGFALGFVPLAAAQAVQRGFVGAYACVAANQVQLAYGHIERGIGGVFEVQKLLQAGAAVGVFLAYVHIDQATVAPYAVGAVYDGVAKREFAQVFNQRFNIAGLLVLATAAALARGAAASKQLAFGNQINAAGVPGKALLERGDGQTDFFIAARKLGQIVKRHRAHTAGTEKVKQAFAAARAFGQQQDAVGTAADVALQAR